MKRRVLSMILTIVMVCSLLPVTSYAATKISNVAITAIEAPVAGASPDYALITGNGYGVTNQFDETNKKVSGVSWYNVTDDRNMLSTETFEYGKVYEVAVSLKVTDGYEFSASDNYTCTTTATVNGNNAGKGKVISGYRAQEVITVNYTFEACDYQRIDKVAVTGIDVPMLGEKPDTTGEVDSNASYKLHPENGVVWWDVTSGTDQSVSQGDTFIAGHQYAVDVCFMVKDSDSYRFKVDEDDCPDVTGTINGFASENVSAMADTIATVRYVFTCNGEDITSVAIADIDEPVAGVIPDFTASTAATGYTFKTGAYYPNGVEWYDETAGESLYPEEDTFVAGHEYTVNVYLQTEVGYTFKTESATLNGQTITIAGSNTSQVVLSASFVCQGYIEDIDLTVTEPIGGNKPDFTKLQGEGYYSEGNVSPYKNGIKWYDETDGKTFVSGTASTFMDGNEYKVTITLKADENFEFKDNATAKVNGKTATVTVTDTMYATVECTFVATHACKITEVKKKDATCTTAGKQAYYHCDGCDKYYEDEEGTKVIADIATWGVIKESGHTIEIQNKKAATETEAGYTGDEYCTTCKQVVTKGAEIPKLEPTTPKPTTPEPSTPEPTTPEPAAKGKTITDTKTNVKYVVTKSDKTNGTVAFSKPKNKKVKSVKVPDKVTIDGITYKVTSIQKNAFSGCTKMTSVTIGKNVTTIGDKAFYKCKALKSITIPSKVSKIGKSAFEGCGKLKTIKIKTTKLTSGKVGSKAFKGTPSNTKVTVPKSSLKSYKKFLYKKGLNKKATIKK